MWKNFPYKSFKCCQCEEEQEQEVVGAFGANLQYGGLGYTTCWSCGHQEWYIVEVESTLTPKQKDFWEKWIEKREEWKKMSQTERETYREKIYSSEQESFKTYFNATRNSTEVHRNDREKSQQDRFQA